MSDFIKGRCHSAKAEYPLPEDEWKRLSVKKCKSWCCTDTVRVEQAPSLRDVYTIVATSPIVVHYSKAQSHTFVADCLSAEDLGSLCLFQGCKAKAGLTIRSPNLLGPSPIPSHPLSCPNLAKHASFLWLWLVLNFLGQLGHHLHSETEILGV